MAFEKFFRVQRGHAAGTSGGNGLPVAMILDIPGNKDSRNSGLRTIAVDEVTVGVHVQLAAKYDGIGGVTNGDENAANLDIADFVGLGVADADTVHEFFFVGENLFDMRGRNELDFFVGARAVNHNFRSAKLIATVNQINAAGVARQEIGFFHGGIPSTDHGDRIATMKITVTGGAGGNTVPHQRAF